MSIDGESDFDGVDLDMDFDNYVVAPDGTVVEKNPTPTHDTQPTSRVDKKDVQIKSPEELLKEKSFYQVQSEIVTLQEKEETIKRAGGTGLGEVEHDELVQLVRRRGEYVSEMKNAGLLADIVNRGDKIQTEIESAKELAKQNKLTPTEVENLGRMLAEFEEFTNLQVSSTVAISEKHRGVRHHVAVSRLHSAKEEAKKIRANAPEVKGEEIKEKEKPIAQMTYMETNSRLRLLESRGQDDLEPDEAREMPALQKRLRELHEAMDRGGLLVDVQGIGASFSAELARVEELFRSENLTDSDITGLQRDLLNLNLALNTLDMPDTLKQAPGWENFVGIRRDLLGNLVRDVQFRLSQLHANATDNNSNQLERIFGKPIEVEEQYRAFQAKERYCNSRIESSDIDPRSAMMQALDSREKDEVSKRVELANAVYSKRIAIGLDGCAKNQELNSIEKEDIKILYNIPGVRQALHEYAVLVKDRNEPTVNEEFSQYLIEMVDTGDREVVAALMEMDKENAGVRKVAEKLKNSNIMMSGSDPELKLYHRFVQYKVRYAVVDGFGQRGKDLDDRTVDLKSIDAEHVAFNLLYISNLFESLDSEWNEKGRISTGSCMNSRMVNISLKLQMNPMDSLIASTLKAEGDFAQTGNLGRWAYEQTRASIEELGEDVSKYDEVVFLDETKDNKDKIWTVDELPGDGYRLNALNCYIPQLVKSAFEDIKIDGKSILDTLYDDEEVRWDEANRLWGGYTYSVGQASEIRKLIFGKLPLKTGVSDDVIEWSNTVRDLLSTSGLANDKRVLRWILYSTVGVKNDERAPRIKGRQNQLRWQFSGDTKLGVNLFANRNEEFFPWDQESGLSRFW